VSFFSPEILPALGFTVAIHVLLAVGCFGWGGLLLRRNGVHLTSAASTVWTGWIVLLFILQAVHCFTPLTGWVTAGCLAPGIAVGILQAVHRTRETGSNSAFTRGSLLMGLAIAAVVPFVVARALAAPLNYDSGLYHFNTLRWINEYPLIPGLGNLHTRLGYNQSFFAFSAALNFTPWFGHGRSLANSFLFLLTFWNTLSALKTTCATPWCSVADTIRRVPPMLTLPVLGFLLFWDNGFAAPTPDLASTLMQLVLFGMVAEIVAAQAEQRPAAPAPIAVSVLLAVAMVTVKLSNSGFALGALAVLAFAGFTSGVRLAAMRLAFPFAILFGLLWVLRGIVLTGYPAFPATIGGVHVPWRVPMERAQLETRIIKGFARNPDRLPHEKNADGWDWLDPWLSRMDKPANWIAMSHPVTVSVFLIGIAALLLLLRRRFPSTARDDSGKGAGAAWLLTVPLLPSALLWFWAAPDPRLANALFYLLPVSAATVALVAAQSFMTPLNSRLRLLAVGSLGIWIFYPNALYIHATAGLEKFATTRWQPVPVVPTRTETTASGLELSVPVSGEKLWDSPIPATPQFNPALRLQKQGELRSGFTTAP
jgi:hypothetical protein